MLGPVNMLGKEQRDLPSLTVRMRLALAYGALFILCATALLAISYLLVRRFPSGATVHLLPPHSQTVSAPGPLKSALPGALKSTVDGLGNHTVRDTAVQAAVSAQRSADLHNLLGWFAVALGIMAVVSVLLGWLMAGRVLRPLRQITATARHISEDNLHERLALAGPSDEITDLSATIDDLLARLEGAFDSQRSFVANASHELRTPLAMMRTSLDVAAAKSPPISRDASALSVKVREGLDQAERLVESFLVLARAERGALDDRTVVSLHQVAADALDARAESAVAADVRLHRRLTEAEVSGSPTLLARLALNLIDNAIRYNEPGGWVQVTTTTGGPFAHLVVENSGPVLGPLEVGQLGQPFRCGGLERTSSDVGVGLGLSIVTAIAAAHQGAVELEARAGGGLRVAVRLPCSDIRRPDRDQP